MRGWFPEIQQVGVKDQADIADEVVLPCFRISEALLSIVKGLHKSTKLVIVDRYFVFELMKDAENQVMTSEKRCW